MSRSKILAPADMKSERERLRAQGVRLVFTNGCFDLLHPGHVRYLTEARAQGDRLVVAVNADETVRKLKGEGRPLVSLDERMELLAALTTVDYVTWFDEETPGRIIAELVPDVLVKGGDWTPDRIVGKDTVEAAGGRVLSLPFAPGYSTSSLIERVVRASEDSSRAVGAPPPTGWAEGSALVSPKPRPTGGEGGPCKSPEEPC